jgi:hypothetical protein
MCTNSKDKKTPKKQKNNPVRPNMFNQSWEFDKTFCHFKENRRYLLPIIKFELSSENNNFG